MKRFVLLLVTVLFSALALAAVNINTANRAELEALPEIGPVKAQAIIDYRNANGPFKSPEDVMKVTGIKEGTYGKIKGLISVSGASTPLPATAPAKTAAPAPTPAPAPAPAPAAKTTSPAATPPAAAAGAASGTDAAAKDAKMTKKE
jgi:competence protein ComEA